jgi:CTP:molybdopterin cytidylyltransferase MocA
MVARVVGAVMEEVGRAAVTAAVAKSNSASPFIFSRTQFAAIASLAAPLWATGLIINEALSEPLVSRTYV